MELEQAWFEVEVYLIRFISGELEAWDSDEYRRLRKNVEDAAILRYNLDVSETKRI